MKETVPQEQSVKITFGLTGKNMEVINKHLSFEDAQYSDRVWEAIGKEIGWHPLTAALWYFRKLASNTPLSPELQKEVGAISTEQQLSVPGQ